MRTRDWKRMTSGVGVMVLSAWLTGCGGGGGGGADALQGTWVGVELGGVTDAPVAMVIEGDTLDYRGATQREWYKATIEIQTRANPNQLVATITGCSDRSMVGKTAYSIYQFEGATLRLAGHAPGTPEPPEEFEAESARRFVFSKQVDPSESP